MAPSQPSSRRSAPSEATRPSSPTAAPRLASASRSGAHPSRSARPGSAAGRGGGVEDVAPADLFGGVGVPGPVLAGAGDPHVVREVDVAGQEDGLDPGPAVTAWFGGEVAGKHRKAKHRVVIDESRHISGNGRALLQPDDVFLHFFWRPELLSTLKKSWSPCSAGSSSRAVVNRIVSLSGFTPSTLATQARNSAAEAMADVSSTRVYHTQVPSVS
ncbi:hypothetical protein KC363_g85 [Hortaea werneckii]|nr:hypothetical protein KC363_g85 [Hortaea werneckii]